MSRSLVLTLVLVAGLAGAGTPAGAAVPPKKRCGTTPRAFTDGSPAVYVAAGTTSCATAKAVMRRYWKSDPSGSRKQSITYNGVRWRCQRVTPSSVPGAWACRSPSGRSVVTAAE